MTEIKVNSSLDTGSKATASSLKSVETSQSQGSAWYTPWSWYSYAAPSTLSPAGITPGTSSESGHSPKTQSEMVKDAALARETGEIIECQSKISVEPLKRTCDPEPNPIASTIESNRSGWASFFTSKTLTVKSLTSSEPSRDENGMEVMDIDEEENASVKGDQNDGNVGIMASSHRNKTTKQAGINLSSSSDVSGNQVVAPPLMIPDSVKSQIIQSKLTNTRGANMPAPRIPPANLILPSWSDTFHTAPRNILPPPPTSKFTKAVKFFGEVLFSNDDHVGGKGKERDEHFTHFGRQLPRAWDVIEGNGKFDLQGYDKVVVIGIHGWFPGAIMRTVLGEPTGTSTKFVNMMTQALDEFQQAHDIQFKKVTKIPLEGEGTIAGRVDKLYNTLLSNQNWMDEIHAADALFVATHSQGSVVSTHLLDRLIRDKHIRTSRNIAMATEAESLPTPSAPVTNGLKPQKICCLALCGIHLGPLRYLSSSSLLQPYIQYFESTAARELFDFQNTDSEVSKAYLDALGNILDHGTKLVYVASLNDQVVPIYSGLFTAISHPLILRALYIDGDAYHSSDFLSNLLVLLLRVLNSGISDSGLLAHLSEATAGSLNGVGHSTAYEELGTYSLAVKYLFLTNDGLEEHSKLTVEAFNANTEQNDYEIPWALRDLIADPRVMHFFSHEIAGLRDAFRDWHPKTTILRDIKRKLQPIQRLPSSMTFASSSKL
ncbi:hypothetical protein BD779DRAFT_1437942 [Infundibulicybe gibba]|nr:hypothetical protein BD779DRAFT_1437942 [Infundibulicybe gibba]